MVDARHCKLRYENGVDLEEFDVFYDFRADDEEFLRSGIGNYKKKKTKQQKKTESEGDGISEQFDSMNVDDDDDDDDDSGEWEDIDTDEDEEMDQDNDDDDDDGDGNNNFIPIVDSEIICNPGICNLASILNMACRSST
mmetsp:Transcript_5875/g.8800  ORF Transcript_5875/g.8800 Transcript_5875/m.8800 type:complete len:139 (+) Transcript_5875:31-447(+)